MKSPSPFSSFDPEGHKPDDAHRRRSPISMRYVIPNVITILAICAGVSGIRLAFEHQYENAILMVLLAAILDGVDGAYRAFDEWQFSLWGADGFISRRCQLWCCASIGCLFLFVEPDRSCWLGCRISLLCCVLFKVGAFQCHDR